MARDYPPEAVSASEIRAHARCPTYGVLDRILPGGAKPAADLGTRVHAIQEAYLRDGTPIDPEEVMMLPNREGILEAWYPGKIALQGVHLLPPRELVTGIEHVWIRREGSLTLAGTIDIVTTEELERVGVSDHYQRRTVVWDHKTSSSPRDYGLTSETLSSDVQGVLYGWAMGASELRWIYYSTRLRGAYVVEAQPRGDLVVPYLRVAQKVSRLRVITDPADAMRLPKDVRGCSAYGGCPYMTRCWPEGQPLSALLAQGSRNYHHDSVGGLMATIDVESILAGIRSKVNGAAASAPPPKAVEAAPSAKAEPLASAPQKQVPANVAVEAAPSAKAEERAAATSEIAELERRLATARAAAMVAPAERSESPAQVPPPQVDVVNAAPPPTRPLPPPSSFGAHLAAWRAAEGLTVTAAAKRLGSQNAQINAWESGTNPRAETLARVAPLIGWETPIVDALPDLEPGESRLRAIEPTSEPEEVGRTDLGWCGTLYEGCAPIVLDLTPHPLLELSDLVAKAQERVRSEYGVSDYGLIEYGRGPAALAAALEVVLSTQSARGIVATLDTRGQRDVIDTVRARATTIVRAYRMGG